MNRMCFSRLDVESDWFLMETTNDLSINIVEVIDTCSG